MRLPGQIEEAILAHGAFVFPEEACGLLAADGQGELRMAYCLTNREHSSTRFTVDPVEHHGALRHAERCGWTIVGSFHTHPRSAPVPSRADIAGALDPDWIYAIAGPMDHPAPQVRLFRITNAEAVALAGAETA